MSRGAHCFEFGPGLVAEIRGAPADLRHFRSEYGRLGVPCRGDPDLVVTFGSGEVDAATFVRGGHKTVRWTVGLSAPDSRPPAMTVQLGGAPRGFARSLVQGYFVEPLLAVVAARSGRVLLPAAALDRGGKALVLLGAAGAGKTTLSARAAAGGITSLGDDQVIVDASPVCWPFPRRMRLYPDLKVTAPEAHALLPARDRAALFARRVAERVTGGYVAPSLRVDAARFGPTPATEPLPIDRVVVIDRDESVAALRSEPLTAQAALELAESLIADQRAHLSRAGDAWAGELERVRGLEREILSALFERETIDRLRMPAAWPAAQAAETLWRELGARDEPSQASRVA